VRVAAIAASSDPDWSFAALTPDGAQRATLARRGDEVGGRRIAFVAWDRVWLARPDGSELCRAELFAKAPQPPPRTSAPASATPVVAGAVPAAIASRIKKIGPNEYEIDRATRDKIIETQSDLMGQTRISPEIVDGRVSGIRLGLKPDSLLGLLGMANGDRIDGINGMDISSPEAALQAFARLREAERLQVKLVRNGQPMTIDYTIK
jgi:general secretion pathway protein C